MVIGSSPVELDGEIIPTNRPDCCPKNVLIASKITKIRFRDGQFYGGAVPCFENCRVGIGKCEFFDKFGPLELKVQDYMFEEEDYDA